MSENASPPLNRDKPWIFRTYAGHSSAQASNALYRKNLEKGQTGLSVAFDLPTQTGYDADHVLSRGEVGKVGVPIMHLGDMRALFDGIPLDRMNTSLTINATAPWLLALYVALADEQGVDRKLLSGTTQNDIIKEYLSRGTYVFPPSPSLRLTTDVVTWAYREAPKWNPTNICSYHLQEAGATPVQEVAFALATAQELLDGVKAAGVVGPADFPELVGRISFFVNAGIRFLTEICKLRAFAELWDEICLQRYNVQEERFRRFRYGVQVNSLGLTEPQPENNVYRILLEMLAVTLSKNTRARAVQLPAWNEALGLPRAWDQQWSLRMQQILAFETDLLEFGDIFEGSTEMIRKTEEIKTAVRAELGRVEMMGGAIAAIESGYMKQELVKSNAARMQSIEAGEQTVVGVNAFTSSERSPLSGDEGGILTVPESIESDAIANLKHWRSRRDLSAVETTLSDLRSAARNGQNIMEPSIAAAKAGVTTGEWGQALREIFGQYRAPTGVTGYTLIIAAQESDIAAIRAKVEAASRRLNEPLKLLVGKPGLDGHSNGAEQIAVRARDCGMTVIYEGIRLTPDEIVASAIREKAHVIGLSILSGSHVPLVRDIMNQLRGAGLGDVPVLVGGIIPAEDVLILKQCGVRAVYTPKDFSLNVIMNDIVDLALRHETEAA